MTLRLALLATVTVAVEYAVRVVRRVVAILSARRMA